MAVTLTKPTDESAAYACLPDGAEWAASFGYPGRGGYREHWRGADGARYVISNGPWDAARPFAWTCERA